MEIINKIAKIREKLDLYGKPYIEEQLLQKLLDKFAPNYTITQLCNQGIITPIKRGKVYINNKYNAYVNPYVVGSLYMGQDVYMFGGLGIYNRYSLTEQVAEWQTIYNTKISGKKIIGKSKFIFVRQRENFFYGGKKEKFEDYSYEIMTIERAFIQLLKEGKIFQELPKDIDKEKLLKMAKEYAPKTIFSKIEPLCI